MGYCMRPLRKGFIIRALNLLQLRKLANIRLSWAVSDGLGHIVFHETSVQIGGEKKIYVWSKGVALILIQISRVPTLYES